MARKIISRAEAKQRRLTRYFTGAPCKHGHIAARITASGSFWVCINERKLLHRSQRPGYRTRAEITAACSGITKQCSECGKTLPNTAEFFQPLKGQGLSAACRECRRARYRDFYQAN